MKILGSKNFSEKAFLVIISGMLTVNTAAWAQEHKMDTGKVKMTQVMMMPAEMIWQDAPAGLPEGAKIAVLSGDPSKAELFSIRLKFPPNYKIPAHTHTFDEHVTVVSGTLAMGIGDKFEDKQQKTYPSGSYTLFPANKAHFAMSKSETIVHIYGMGPFSITYVNPAEDPRNKK